MVNAMDWVLEIRNKNPNVKGVALNVVDCDGVEELRVEDVDGNVLGLTTEDENPEGWSTLIQKLVQRFNALNIHVEILS